LSLLDVIIIDGGEFVQGSFAHDFGDKAGCNNSEKDWEIKRGD